MRNFRFEWHIAHSKALKKTDICSIYLWFPRFTKKIWKIKERKSVNCEQPYSSGFRAMSKYQFSTQMTKFVRLPPEITKAEKLFAPTAPNKLRLSAETAVLQTSLCPKTKLTGVQEFWWALIKEFGFVPRIYPHVDKKTLRIIEEWMKCLHLKQSRQSRSQLSHLKS